MAHDRTPQHTQAGCKDLLYSVDTLDNKTWFKLVRSLEIFKPNAIFHVTHCESRAHL